MILNLTGLQTVVIGGTNGIGLAIAKGFLEEGAIVHIIARNKKERLETELTKAYPRKIFFYSCDVTDEKKMVTTCTNILENAQQMINIVVANVGSGKGASEAIVSHSEWEFSWNTNFNSALIAARVFSAQLIKTKGSLLFISSIAGVEFIGAPVSYGTAKSALVTFSKSLSHKLAPDVRVNVVCPGNIWIENGTWDYKMKLDPNKVASMLEEKVPLRRFGLPEEISNLVLFLSSEKASFITGGCFVIDGGQTTGF